MTALTPPASWRGRLSLPPRPAWLPRVQRVESVEPPSTRTVVASYALTLLATTLLVLVVNLTLVSQLQHFTAQHRLYDELRLSLAEGSAPIGQIDVDGRLVEPGTPIALLQIPRLGVHEVVVEGTTSEQTKLGVGHRRDTPYPGQAGVAVLAGRSAAYGGVFRHLAELRAGDDITVTTGQGESTYRVLGPRLGKTTLPALGTDDGRLTLVTASGRPFQPTGALRVDAQLVGSAFPRPTVAFAQGVLDPDEQVLAGDHSRLFALSWLLELMVLLSVGAVWAWKRWDTRVTWVVFTPLLAVTAFACADRICDLLPNVI